jgi:hypothetical protein
MRLLDLHLPAHEFSETHWVDIPVEPGRAMTEVLAWRPEDDRFFRFAIRLRELPMRVMRPSRRAAVRPAFGMDNFTLLQREGDREVAYGLAGKLWQADYGQYRIADANAFDAFDTPGSVKLVVSFMCELLPSGLTRLTTETRVHCIDADAFRRFRPYWYLIRPVSGLIRRRMLRSIARRCTGQR